MKKEIKMALIEKINSMRQQGLRDSQIISSLSEEGFSPMEINDGLSQANIKSAISGSDEQNTNENNMDLQPSIMSAAETEQVIGTPESMSQTPIPQYTQEQAQYSQEQYPAEQYTTTQGYDQTQYTPEQYAQAQQYGYPPQQEYYQQGVDLETVRDIAKQETEEAIRKIKEHLASFEKLKTELKFELQDIENRVVKIENIITELQSAIIRKMGEYGSAISGISQEIRATQNAFSKIINPVLDKKRGINSEEEIQQPNRAQQISQSQMQKGNPQNKENQKSKPSQRSNDKSVSFEDYFR